MEYAFSFLPLGGRDRPGDRARALANVNGKKGTSAQCVTRPETCLVFGPTAVAAFADLGQSGLNSLDGRKRQFFWHKSGGQVGSKDTYGLGHSSRPNVLFESEAAVRALGSQKKATNENLKFAIFDRARRFARAPRLRSGQFETRELPIRQIGRSRSLPQRSATKARPYHARPSWRELALLIAAHLRLGTMQGLSIPVAALLRGRRHLPKRPTQD